jgi:hypothetical protein
MPSGFPLVSSSELIVVHSGELSGTSPARARPTFATDDGTRESTMPSGFPLVSSSELIVVRSGERIVVRSGELSGTFLCTSETNVCNR